jgi:hypothetical protein
MLEIVEDQQQFPGTQMLAETADNRLVACIPQPEDLRNSWHNQPRLG